jgi:hypothetical protein
VGGRLKFLRILDRGRVRRGRRGSAARTAATSHPGAAQNTARRLSREPADRPPKVRSISLGFLILVRDDDRLTRSRHASEIRHAAEVAEIPRQRPVIRTHDRYSRLVSGFPWRSARPPHQIERASRVCA